MHDTPKLVQTTAQATAVIRLTIPRSEIQRVMGPAIGHTSAPDLWECSASGPESGADSSKWRTEFNRPLLR